MAVTVLLNGCEMWTIETKFYNNLKASKPKFLPTVNGRNKEEYSAYERGYIFLHY